MIIFIDTISPWQRRKPTVAGRHPVSFVLPTLFIAPTEGGPAAEAHGLCLKEKTLEGCQRSQAGKHRPFIFSVRPVLFSIQWPQMVGFCG